MWSDTALKPAVLPDHKLLLQGTSVASCKSPAKFVSPGNEGLPRAYAAYLHPRSHQSGCLNEWLDLSENAACLDHCYWRRKFVGSGGKMENGRKASKDWRPSRVQPRTFADEGEQARRFG